MTTRHLALACTALAAAALTDVATHAPASTPSATVAFAAAPAAAAFAAAPTRPATAALAAPATPATAPLAAAPTRPAAALAAPAGPAAAALAAAATPATAPLAATPATAPLAATPTRPAAALAAPAGPAAAALAAATPATAPLAATPTRPAAALAAPAGPAAASLAAAPARPAAAALAAAPAGPAAASPAASASPSATPAPGASPSPPAASDPDAGLTWTLPTGWQAVRSQLTALAQPVHRLAAATFPLRQDAPDRDCGPDTARAQMPAGGALVYLLEDREAEARPRGLAHYPARPAHFRIGRARTYECLGLGAIVWWTEQGRAFQAQVVLGPRAGRERRRQVEALLDSLVVQAIAPPAPPIGWRSAISGAYDSIRVPPGWKAHALQRVHTRPRPRTLFRVANRAGTVVVRVTEHPRGRPSPAFPPASSTLVFDAHRRAGLSFRGFRFSIRIFTRPGASASDVAWAEVSARSLGVSGVGRG